MRDLQRQRLVRPEDAIRRTVERQVIQARALGGGGGGGGVTDHGALTGLGDDDHPQYLTQTEGDARYAPAAYTKTVTLTGPTEARGTLEHRETVVDAAVSATSKIVVSLGTFADSDENDAEMLDLIGLAVVPASGQFEVVLAFAAPQRGAIPINYTV